MIINVNFVIYLVDIFRKNIFIKHLFTAEHNNLQNGDLATDAINSMKFNMKTENCVSQAYLLVEILSFVNTKSMVGRLTKHFAVQTRHPRDRRHFKEVKHLVQTKIRTAYNNYLQSVLGLSDEEGNIDTVSDKQKFAPKKLFSLIKNAKWCFPSKGQRFR